MVEPKAKMNPGVFVIFGAGGDLTWRKLIPSIFGLWCKKELPDAFAVLGVDLKEMSDEDFRAHLLDGVQQFSPDCAREEDAWKDFAGHLSYLCGNFDSQPFFTKIGQCLQAYDKEWGFPATRVFYQATPPGLVEIIVSGLAKAHLNEDRDRARIVLEKPFGHDQASALQINQMLLQAFNENQIYRIDHYLGKETVQNILAFRFSNGLFEPVWNREYIKQVQITVAESVGVGHRGPYYENAGALRDMVQNHLMQILCLIAMEPMVNFEADEIRNKKVDVLHAIRCIEPAQVNEYAVRGQYGPGWIKGDHAVGYRSELGVAPSSNAETYAALKLFVDNWRWQDVPFYLRTGKYLSEKSSVAVIEFRQVPHRSFPNSATNAWQPNRLVIQIQPNEGILLTFQAKQPGSRMRLSPATLRFYYEEEFHSSPPEAYETLLLDVLLGDQTLFMRADQVACAWGIIDPILQNWADEPPTDFPNYPAGSWGPEEAARLLSKDGHFWYFPKGTAEEEKQ